MGRPDTGSDARLLAAHLRPERARVAALVGVLVVAMLLPVAGPLLLGHIIDAALDGEPTSALVTLALAYLAVTLTADGLQLAVTWWSVQLAWRVGNRLRLDLARHALSLDLSWHGEHSPGLLIERIDGDMEAVVKFSSAAVLQLAGNAILLAGVLVVSFIIDWRAGLMIALAAAVAVGIMVRLRSVAVAANDAEREVNAQLYGDLEERLGGLEDLRANGAGGYVVHRLQTHSSHWWRAARRVGFVGAGAYAVAAAAFSVGAVATLAVAVWLNRRGELSIGSTLALFRFAQMVRQPIESIAEQLREFQKAVASARRAGRLLATPLTIVDGPGEPLPDGPLAVDLDHVTFGYGPDRTVLDDVDVHLAPGTVLGVVGRSGSGKTTIGRLLLRFWDVTEGGVRLGGVDVREATHDELRRRIGIVTQEVELFRASVRDNLTLFDTVPADDAALIGVLEEVGLGRWFSGLTDGLDTVLEGDTHISAGEAQLVAFARVLLADPGLVVLDEATSRLDPHTEEQVNAVTRRLLASGQRTVVVIAHRLVTVERVDEILVLDRGRIVEHGRRADLAADPSSRYAELVNASKARQAVAS